MFAETAQTKIDADLRVSIMRLGIQNGGLRNLAREAAISYNALWGQLNRGQGVLARVIHALVRATRDTTPLWIIADECDCVVAPKPKFKRREADVHEVREREITLAITLGHALDVIEKSIATGYLTSLDRDRIRQELARVCEHGLELRGLFDTGHYLRAQPSGTDR